MGAREGVEGGTGRIGRQHLRQVVDRHVEATRIGDLRDKHDVGQRRRRAEAERHARDQPFDRLQSALRIQCRYQASTSAWLRPNGPFR